MADYHDFNPDNGPRLRLPSSTVQVRTRRDAIAGAAQVKRLQENLNKYRALRRLVSYLLLDICYLLTSFLPEPGQRFLGCWCS